MRILSNKNLNLAGEWSTRHGRSCGGVCQRAAGLYVRSLLIGLLQGRPSNNFVVIVPKGDKSSPPALKRTAVRGTVLVEAPRERPSKTVAPTGFFGRRTRLIGFLYAARSLIYRKLLTLMDKRNQ